MHLPRSVRIYTDGSCTPSLSTPPDPSPGGWAAILQYTPRRQSLVRRLIAGHAADTTANCMELTAVIEAFRLLKRPSRVIVHTDSHYVIDGITVQIHKWLKHGWRVNAKRELANKELWRELHLLVQPHTVEWRKTKRSHTLLRKCDEMARSAKWSQTARDEYLDGDVLPQKGS